MGLGSDTLKFYRQSLLRTLESVAPGLNSKDTLEQSSCFVFNEGEVVTYNSEILCVASIKNDEGEAFQCYGAVPAKPLLETLRKSPDDEIDLKAGDDHISIKGTGRRQKIVMANQILLDTQEVERPDEFQDLPPVFSEALTLAASYACKDADEFALNCVAVSAKGLQATNRLAAIRYAVGTGLAGGTALIRATSAKNITGLGLAKASYGKEFVWFTTYAGTQVALRLLDAEYPTQGLTQIFQEPLTTKLELPGSVADIVARTLPFLGENAAGKVVEIHVDTNLLTVRAQNAVGEFVEEKPISYDGERLAFRVNPESLQGIFRTGSNLEVTPSSLRTKGDGYCLVISAEQI